MSYAPRTIAIQDGRCARHHQKPLRSERGSALLIVFVFAAMIAIMLYMEVPIVAFEAQRDREQDVVDRGNEYAHAVKLFVRKFGMYPASMDQLENTNRMRFLRHRYKDPLTGKDDWRLLHAGPNGQLLDSKVSPISNSPKPADGNSGAGTAGPSATNASTTNASTGSAVSGFNSDSSSQPPEVVVPSVPQRRPAVAASVNGELGTAPQAEQDPTAPLLPPGQAPNTAAQNGPPTVGVQAGQETGQNVPQNAGQNVGETAAAAQGNAQTAAAGTPNGMATVRSLLNNPNAPPQTSSSRTGTITGGGIAGVASKAGGHSIKTVNDQSDYRLWEFYYDPTKDATRGIAFAAQRGAAQSAAQIGGQNSPAQNPPLSNAPAASSPSPGTPTEAPEPPEATENPPQ
jgi:hypothetical protein